MQLTTAEAAVLARVNPQTLRYYERRGLLAEPARTAAGYRQYDWEAVRRVRFIKRAQDLGFKLEEIDELLDLRVDGDSACGEVEARALTTLTRVEDKIRQLERMRDVLGELAKACSMRAGTEACPILEALEADD